MILKMLEVRSAWKECTNCYIVHDEKSKETMVIDPGGEPDRVMELLDILQANVKYIYLTHCHGDHIAGVNEIKQKKGGKTLIHVEDAESVNNPEINMCPYMNMKPEYIEIDARVNDGDLLHVGDIELKVIHTPGHTKGGSSLYSEKDKMLFSGDTLFKGTWGRTDLPTSDFKDVINSISNKLLILPDSTIVYPGHGEVTTIREEEPIYYNLKPRED